jgi:hypothetical protein
MEGLLILLCVWTHMQFSDHEARLVATIAKEL